MPEYSELLVKRLDRQQECPFCHSAMYWIEAQFQQQILNFHQCSQCGHCIFYGDYVQSCHCPQCLQQRKTILQQDRKNEAREQHLLQQQRQDDSEIILNQLPLIHKLFLLALLDGKVNEQAQHQEFINFHDYVHWHIAPSQQLFHYLKRQCIYHHYILPVSDYHDECFFPNLRLIDYRQPSLLTLTQQLQAWFFYDLTRGVPYQDENEVKDTLTLLLTHDIISYCQLQCQQWQCRFGANKLFIEFCQTLLQDLSHSQILYLIDRAFSYLYTQKLLHPENKNFVNTNRLRKTMMQYREKGLQQHWETYNLMRPSSMPTCRMNHIFFNEFLRLGDKVYVQPVWKCWHDIVPKLRFFVERHCIHCGSRDVQIEYSHDNNVSLRCLRCQQQDHYFIR